MYPNRDKRVFCAALPQEMIHRRTTMALIEDMFKGGNILTGLAIGVGAAVVVPIVTPMLRPIAKSALKAGIAAYDQGRAALSELSETTGDLVAEARQEMSEMSESRHDASEPPEAESSTKRRPSKPA
jgi:Protein of unknown function (DUF5132)